MTTALSSWYVSAQAAEERTASSLSPIADGWGTNRSTLMTSEPVLDGQGYATLC
jgi:hypothetical protein